MEKKNRIFVSFAVEDANLRDFLVGQGKNNRTPFSFIDMSVKQPWDNSWKTQCRAKIKSCDGLIGIVTSNTSKAEGQIWEVKCAYDEDIPVLLIYGYSNNHPTNLQSPIKDHRIYTWSWDNIENFLSRL